VHGRFFRRPPAGIIMGKDTPQVAGSPSRPPVSTMRHAIRLLALVACLGATRTGDAGEDSRYTAVLVDGRRFTGEKIEDWGRADGSPRLEGQPLLEGPAPVRWLADNTLTAGPPPPSFVEFWGGDRLPGVVVRMHRFDPQRSELAGEDYLVVEPRVALDDSSGNALEQVRVLERAVRRIVWHRSSAIDLRPATLILRDGRKLSFRTHRFQDEAVQLLAGSGVETYRFSEIAELHMPWTDPWEAYLDELASLCPGLPGRLFQLETATGLIATSSEVRFQARSPEESAPPEQWRHLIHPAWSLDAFVLPHQEVAVRRYFAAHEVPLVRIAPMQSENRSAMHASWMWRVNRNVHGRPLYEGREGCAWGFGVHGEQALTFPITALARYFRTRAKLDRTVGEGGCVRAVVLAGTTDGARSGVDARRREIYRSQVLVGSKTVLDSGNLALDPAGAGQTRFLTLAVDPVNENRPEGADPLDIRDTLNWLEPVVVLDRAALAAEVRRRSAELILPFRGWTLDEAGRRGMRLVGRWDALPGRGLDYRFAVDAPGSLRLSRTIPPGDPNRWLLLSATRLGEETPPATVEVRIDGQLAGEHLLPQRPSGGGEHRPIVHRLPAKPGQAVSVEIIQRPAEPGAGHAVVDWRNLLLCERLPFLREVFEDGADLVLGPDAGHDGGPAPPTAELVAGQSWSGERCLRIQAGGRVSLKIGPEPAAIRAQPDFNEYRYLRFAFRKRGRGHVQVELHHDAEHERPLRYFAGRGESSDEAAKRVWIWSTHADLPDAWIVETRDLHADFEQFEGELSGVTLACTGGTEVLFDHVYLGRAVADLELVPAKGPHPPDVAAYLARAAMARRSLDKVFPATVLLGIDERVFTGVIVSADGTILTCGHTVVRPGRDVTVVLHDGRTVKAKSLGVDRENDVAMIRIISKGKYPYVELADPVPDLRKELLLGVAHWDGFEAGDRPAAHLTWIREDVDAELVTNFRIPLLGSGGPLLVATNDSPQEGRLVGIQSRVAWGTFLYTPVETIQGNWDRLKRGDVWGRWPSGAGPLVGVFTQDDEQGCKITQLIPGGGAEQAGLQLDDVILSVDGRKVGAPDGLWTAVGDKEPGQKVTLQVKRSEQTLRVKLTLGFRK